MRKWQCGTVRKNHRELFAVVKLVVASAVDSEATRFTRANEHDFIGLPIVKKKNSTGQP